MANSRNTQEILTQLKNLVSAMETPYISIVLVGRNDGYGDNFLLRLKVFIQSLDWQVRNLPNLVELIITEWNPPEDSPPLKDVIHKPKNFNLRIITVPNKLHNKTNTELPLIEGWGKNVGARRARGEFVLITNPDIIFSNSLVLFLAERNLSTTCLYRLDRYDYKGEGIENLTPNQYQQFVIDNTFTGHVSIEGHKSLAVNIVHDDLGVDLPVTDTNLKSPHTNASGDFLLISKDGFTLTRGLIERPDNVTHLDSYSLCRFIGTGYEQKILNYPICVFHWDHPRRTFKNEYDIEVGINMAQRKGTVYNNDPDDWGFGNEILEEWESSR